MGFCRIGPAHTERGCVNALPNRLRLGPVLPAVFAHPPPRTRVTEWVTCWRMRVAVWGAGDPALLLCQLPFAGNSPFSSSEKLTGLQIRLPRAVSSFSCSNSPAPSPACSEGLGARRPQASEGGFVLPPGGDSPAHAGCKLHFAVFLSWMHLKADGSLYSLAVSGRTGKKGTA